MTTYRVIALDPGGTTGWATYTATKMSVVDDDRMITEWYNPVWNCGQLGPEEHHDRLEALLESERVTDYTVVCESFEFRQGKQRNNLDLSSKEYIGVVKLFKRRENVPTVFQTAGQAKTFIPDKAVGGLVANQKLKVLGLYHPNHKHAMDAMRHLVTYLVQKERRYDLVTKWKDL